MWAFVRRWFGFPRQAAGRPMRLKAEPGCLRQDWNGTVLSMESYR